MSLKDKLRKAGVKRPPQPKAPLRLRPEILLCPNVPKPMHGVAPRVVLGEKWWRETRQAAYKSTSYHCLACGVYKMDAKHRQWMEGHELYSIDYAKGRAVYLETVPLCHFCHNYIHDGRLQALLDKGQITHSKYASIIQHGDAVLLRAGLVKPRHSERESRIELEIQEGRVAPWGDWRMVINGVEYPPKYATIEEWALNYGIEL